MVFRRLCMHIGVIIAGVLIILGIPLWISGGLRDLLFSLPDAVSSASIIQKKPSGNYYVLINKEFHRDADKLRDWASFFRGEDVLYIFEDVACSTAVDDPGGCELAEHYQSRLPENQMQVDKADGILLASRIDHELYDIAIMSAEFASSQDILQRVSESAMVIETTVAEMDGEAAS